MALVSRSLRRQARAIRHVSCAKSSILMYILSTGVSRRSPRPAAALTLYDYFTCADARLIASTRALCAVPPSRRARASPTAAIIDSQSVKSAKKPAIIRRLRCSKKIKQKRHISSIRSLLMHAIVHAADVQDRDGGALLMASLFGAFPFLIKLYADGGYQGPEFQSAVKRILARVTSRSSSDRIKPQASSHCPSAGSLNAPSLGSAAADDWPRTGNVSTTRPSPSCASPPSASCCLNRLSWANHAVGVRRVLLGLCSFALSEPSPTSSMLEPPSKEDA